MEKKKYIIVGGGLAGLFAANALLSKSNVEVTLVESADRCGGLLSAFKSERGIKYDQGTHLASKTGIAEIDNILFAAKSFSTEWSTFPFLNAGNYFAGAWNTKTQVADIRHLSEPIYAQSVAAIMSRIPPETESFTSYVKSNFGPPIFEHLFLPVVNKLYGKDVNLNDLKSDVGYFGLNRVVAFDTELTEKLKEIIDFDNKIAFETVSHYAKKSTTDTSFYYPKHPNGIQYWVDELTERAVSKGLKLLLRRRTERLETSEGSVSSIVLDDGTRLECDEVVWTIPVPLALKQANIEYSSSFKPKLMTANLFHFMFDKPVSNTDNQYVWNWDADFKTFRITLYDNFAEHIPQGYRVTMEILTGPSDDNEVNIESAISELKAMNLITSNHKILDSSHQIIKNTFPEPTKQLSLSNQALLSVLNDSLSNIIVAGRHSAKVWSQSDVLQDIYQQLNLSTLKV